MTVRFQSKALVALLLSLASCSLALPSLPAKCTACKGIAAELNRRIQAEKPRNHLDMRHRLDSEGQRYGRMIDYKVSELRAVELLDGLCSAMKDYSLIVTKPPAVNATADGNATEAAPAPSKQRKTKHWMKVSGKGAQRVDKGRKLSKYEDEAMTKKLEIFCGAFMEEHEDALTQHIMEGKMDRGPGSVETVVCGTLTRLCPMKQLGQKPAQKKPPPQQQQQQQEGAAAAKEPGEAAGAPGGGAEAEGGPEADDEGIDVAAAEAADDEQQAAEEGPEDAGEPGDEAKGEL